MDKQVLLVLKEGTLLEVAANEGIKVSVINIDWKKAASIRVSPPDRIVGDKLNLQEILDEYGVKTVVEYTNE